MNRRLMRRLTTLAMGLAATLGFAVPAQAQVGLTEWRAGALPVTLVYPTQAPAGPHSIGPFRIDVALNAAPLAQRQRLVVLSHGTGGSAVADHALAATLARAGFVVAQPLHAGDNWQDTTQPGPPSFERRPQEVIQVIDALAQDPQWSARLALDKVGVHGMSAGGVTGLTLAGGQWRLLNLVRHCNAHPVADEGFCFQGTPDGPARAERQARFDKARWWPDFVLPASLKTVHGGRTPTAEAPDPRPDARVAAVSLAVPLAAIFSPESLARIRIPVGVVSAQRDELLLPRFHSGHVLAHCKTCTLLGDLPGAGHFDLLWPWPESVARDVAAAQVRGGLPVPGFDPRRREDAHARIAAFHRQHLLPLP
jgi:predicted dienelactone hydrolase